jgi:hypothetical protein
MAKIETATAIAAVTASFYIHFGVLQMTQSSMDQLSNPAC